jgi:hypothetical protein
VHYYRCGDARLTASVVKRSRSIRLVLISGLSTSALTGCHSGSHSSAISPAAVYTNNYYVAGVGYYHAPFRAWYQYPYNHFDPLNRRYFHGGQWSTEPHYTITNISSPTPVAAQQAQAQRTDIRRGGFGGSSRHHHISS